MNLDADNEKIREDFPALRTRTFLDTASFCPYSTHVLRAINDFLEIMQLAPSNTFEQFFLQASRAEEAKKEAAKLVNCSESEIGLINTTSQGMCIIANSLKWEPGDNIVTTDQTHPCCTVPFMGFPEVEIRTIDNINGGYSLSDFEKAIDDKTKLITLCQTEWINGFTHNLAAIKKIADEHGAYVANDPGQSLGQLEVDVKKTGVDFISIRCYKWPTGPLNGGILYVKKDLIEKLVPPYRSFRLLLDKVLGRGQGVDMWAMSGNQNPASHPIYSYAHLDYVKTAKRFEEPSIPDIDAWALNAALKYINGLGIGNIRKRVMKLSDYLVEGLLDIGCRLNTPIENMDQRSGLVNYTTGSYKVDYESVRSMNSMGVSVSLRYSAAEKGWKDGMRNLGGIRVSTHFFNNEEDIDRLLKLQKALLS